VPRPEPLQPIEVVAHPGIVRLQVEGLLESLPGTGVVAGEGGGGGLLRPRPGREVLLADATAKVEAHGAEIPVLGLGTWQLSGAAARRMVETALEMGYRHLDAAQAYGNESERMMSPEDLAPVW
jgi:hypothetical protein